MVGVDTSYLVALAIKEHTSHQSAWNYYDRTFKNHKGVGLLAPQVLQEWLHIVTDPKRFERPFEMSTALKWVENFETAQEFRSVYPDAETTRYFLQWMKEHTLCRKRILDTSLAATYHRAGAKAILTTNWRDFEIFKVFSKIEWE
jgi:predicted nucleic acid-binding protein